MDKSNKSNEFGEQLNKEQNELFKLKNSKLKLTCLLIVCTFLLPLFPLRNGSLSEQYGYWGGVLFACVITFGITPLIYIFIVESKEQKIKELKRKKRY